MQARAQSQKQAPNERRRDHGGEETSADRISRSSAPYQALLLLKLLLVGGMLVLALVNRYVFVPRIPEGPGVTQLRDGTIAEIVVSAVILGLVSVLGVLSPS